MIQVSQLAIYPLKSGGQIPLQAAKVDAFGLHMDRRWMVIDDNGHFVTQRQLPRMCLIQPVLNETGVVLQAPQMQDCNIAIDALTEKKSVTVWMDSCQALDCGDEAASWLSAFLDIKCRLVYFPDEEFRQVDLNFAQQGERTAFSDGFPFLLISEASLQDLNKRIKQNSHSSTIEMRRFRPNIVVSGCEPYAEDQWKRIQIGEMQLRVVKPCSRCVIPGIDPDTGVRGDEPLKTLKEYRKEGKKIFFGQNVIAESTGRFEIDMPVTVLE